MRRKRLNIGFSSIKALTIMSIFVLLPIVVASQDREALERNRVQIEGEIRLINQMLQDARNSAEAGLSHLVILNTQINRRERLLETNRRDIATLDREITAQERELVRLGLELDELRYSFARMIRKAYITRSAYQRLAFIISSESFNQARSRLIHLQDYARHRRVQAQVIERTQARLTLEIARLELQKDEKEQLVAEQARLIGELNREKSEQDRIVRDLRRRERELSERLRRQERARQDLQRSIERIIAEERRRAQEQARAAGRRVAPGEFPLSPEERTLSGNFAANRGKLPWPVERGVISGTFGVHQHPVLRNIQVVNNGIDFSTTPGARARAVYEGRVSRVVTVPGAFYAVIIRHGEYLTVYSNLSRVLVNNGDRVTTRQDIGIVATNNREGNTVLHFELWHGNQKMNPQQWIAAPQ